MGSLRRRVYAFLFSLAAMLVSPHGLRGDALCQADAKLKAPNKVPLQAFAFDLRDVRLLDGPFRRAMDLDKRYLLSLDVNRLLRSFRLNAGLPSSAAPLGGWETPDCEVRGHFLGHYLSACALMYASTGDQRLQARCAALVTGLAECQARFGDGYLSAFPKEFFDRVEQRKPVWVPYYTLHKILAGLLDAYVYCDNPRALEVAEKLGAWIIHRNAKLSDAQVQKMLDTEHGGINEALANLYGLTGEQQYLTIAARLNHAALIGPFSRRNDVLTGLHANTQIPKFIGTARQYELTGQEPLKTASSFFWETVAKERSYVIGGHSDSEAFSPKEKLSQALGPDTTETCNTYNMLKLTRHLFCWEPRAEYADFYERALYNHILASQNPADGMMCYYVPLRAGSAKTYSTPEVSFFCCTGTGVENHAKYGDSIYFHDADKTLYVNLFIASELHWKAKGLTLRQETNYPDESNTCLRFACKQPTELTLRVRRPWWATAGCRIRVNGKLENTASRSGDYAAVTRRWLDGDTLDVSLPFPLHSEAFRDNPKRFAFLHGPVVLCAEVPGQLRPGVELRKPFPGAAAKPEDAAAALKPVPGRPSTFTAPAGVLHVAADQGGREVVLEPFYKMHGGRHYVVYWDSYTPTEWAAIEAEHRRKLQMELARQQDFQRRTIDAVSSGDEASERAHNLQGDHTAWGEFQGRRWRHAVEGGWFSWELKTAGTPIQLCVTYWGSDVGRQFDILVDGVKVATQKLQNNRPSEFYDEVYDVPLQSTSGKSKVTVRFQGGPGGIAGGVFQCRVLKKN
jgi:uncharacterized protein